MVVFWFEKYRDFIMCKTCNLKHVRKRTCSLDRRLVIIGPEMDSTVKIQVSNVHQSEYNTDGCLLFDMIYRIFPNIHLIYTYSIIFWRLS